MKKWLLLAIALMMLIALIIKVQNILISASDSSLEATPIENQEPLATANYTGEYTCLPNKNTNGPQTLECAIGIKLDDGTYMALNFDEKISIGDLNLATGQRLEVRGTVVPVEELSSDHWQKYNMTGIIQVVQVIQL